MKHCFYHNDLDGHCAGAIVKLVHPDCEMHEINYGYDFNNDVLGHIKSNACDIFVVDFSFSPKEFDLLINEGHTVTWIDHHFTAIDKVTPDVMDNYDKLEGIWQTDKAGCELTWGYFHENEAMPMAVYYVGRWDVWDHRNPSTIPFHRGMTMLETDPANPDAIEGWRQLFDNNRSGKNKDWNLFDQVMNLGLISEKMKAEYDKYIAKNAYYVKDWVGYRTVALNSKVYDSYCIFEYDGVFEVFDPEVLVWYYQTPDGNWLYQLRSYPGTTTDVSQIAKANGGGGHVGAAGFKSKNLLIKPTGLERKWSLFTNGVTHVKK